MLTNKANTQACTCTRTLTQGLRQLGFSHYAAKELMVLERELEVSLGGGRAPPQKGLSTRPAACMPRSCAHPLMGRRHSWEVFSFFTHTCTYIHTHACAHAHTHARTQTRTHAHTHACAHTHARTHTHTHTHTGVAGRQRWRGRKDGAPAALSAQGKGVRGALPAPRVPGEAGPMPPLTHSAAPSLQQAARHLLIQAW